MGAGIAAGLVPPDADPSACLYHLFGYDFAADPKGRLRLLEVNAYPAIASGERAQQGGGACLDPVPGCVETLHPEQ